VGGAKAEEYAKASALWDGKVVNVQVCDAKERTMKIRILMSASDWSKARDLHCEVCENLIGYIRDNYAGSLPSSRWDGIEAPDGTGAATSH
jgi:hypothetical protein